MFAALHEELKGYKDGFLLDSVHRPIIRDLISLYDDTAEIHRQVCAAIAEAAEKQDPGANCSEFLARIRTIEMNLEHHMEFIREVLNRLEVTLMPSHTGKLDKQTQRAVALELAENPEQDNTVVRAVKQGFMWKDRIFRAEEVVIRKWKEGCLVALKPEPKQ
jgi:molecular chaperone GrpE (heat shock protein)